MLLKFNSDKKTYKIKICHNKLNKFWNPNGFYYNISKIEINKKWYNCDLNINQKNREIMITNIREIDERNVITAAIKDAFIVKSTNIVIQIIKILLNKHNLNVILYKLKKKIYERRITVFVIILGLLLSLIYFIIDTTHDKIIMKSILDNVTYQTVMVFLTFSSFINIFFPFTIRKEITSKDVENISENKAKETLKKIKKDEDELKQRQEFSTF